MAIDKALILNEIKLKKNFKTDSDFAKFLGIKPQTLSSWYSRNMFDIELLYSKCVDINANWLLTGEGSMFKDDIFTEKMKIPIIPLIPIEAMAGYGEGENPIGVEDITEGYNIPDFSEKGVKYMIRVSGSSMYPKYSNGDLLGCKPIHDLSFIQWGKSYVLDTDQGAIVKRIFPVDGEPEIFECRSDNAEKYPPFKIHKKSIYRIAIVVGVLRLE